MKKIEEVFLMISFMSDDMPIYEFNILKHRTIAGIDKNAKRKRESPRKRANLKNRID